LQNAGHSLTVRLLVINMLPLIAVRPELEK